VNDEQLHGPRDIPAAEPNDSAASAAVDHEVDRVDHVPALSWVVAIVGVIIVGLFFLVNSAIQQTLTATTTIETAADRGPRLPLPPLVLSRMRIRDTIYTTDSLYLDVDLSRQDVTVRFRDGSSRRFLISSGNRFLRDGMATPTGVFTVQNQVPLAISKQFNDARLHHWIGIQGGVGFHGLDGSGYYGYLGVRPSSHGCVRMSRHEIAEMYKLVHPGALIVVHYGDPARVVAFCQNDDTVGAHVIDSAAVYDRGLGRDRLQVLMSGGYWTKPVPRLVHLARQRVRWGMAIGEASRIPRQELPASRFLADFSQHLPVARRDQAVVGTERSAGEVADLVRAIALRDKRADSLDRTAGMLGD